MAANPDQPGFNPGGIPSQTDTRDYQWAEIGAAAAPFDWTAGYDIETELGTTLKPKDQGDSGSCGGQAWSMAAAALEAFATKSLEERSAKYIYSQTFVPGGGSAGRDNSNIYVKQGCAREVMLSSYANGQPPSEAFMERPQDITPGARADAALDQAISYANVALNIDALAQAMKANHGVCIGVDGSNNGTWLSEYPAPPKNGENIWRHWLYAGKAKEVNGVKYLGVINSWGATAGQNGWQWLSEAYVNTMLNLSSIVSQQAIWEAWTLVYNPSPAQPGFTHDFARDIPYGEQSSEVVALQTALQADGTFPKTVPCTGYYGDITRTAVLNFQVKYQVAPLAELQALNGKNVGPATRTKLNSLFNK